MNKVFVAGLSWDLTNDQLKDYFAQAGTVVSANVITDRMTGKSRGFGFVEMSSAEEAQKAISTLDNTTLAGRTINVKEAKPQERRDNFSGGGYGGGGGRDRGDRGRGDKRQDRW